MKKLKGITIFFVCLLLMGCGKNEGSSRQRYESQKKNYYEKEEMGAFPFEGDLLGCKVDNGGDISLFLQQEKEYRVLEIDNAANKKREVDLSLQGVDGLCAFGKDREGNYLIGGENGTIYRYNDDGKQMDTMQFEKGCYKIGVTEKGEICTGVAEMETLKLSKLTGDKFEVQGTLSICGESYFSFATGGSYLSFYDERYLYQYDPEREIADPVICWMDEEIAVECVCGVKLAEDGSILLVENEGEEICIARYTPQKKGSADQRQELILAGVGMDENVRKQVLDFNQKNGDYKILVKDYAGGGNPYEALNLDIVSGKQFDIIYLTQMPVREYIEKGMLEDLTAYLHIEDFIDSYIHAITTEKGIYQVSPVFTLYTVLGRTNEVGSQCGWTYEEFASYLEGKDEETISVVNKMQLLRILLKLHIEDFVDWDTGEVALEKEQFINLLEFVKQYPEKEVMDIDYLEKIRNGQVDLVEVPLTSGNIYRLYRYVYGEDITAVGYPNDKEQGNYMELVMPMGISHSSEHKDGAWEFVSEFLSEEVQYTYQDYGFPTRKDVWDNLCHQWMDSKEDMTVYLGGKECSVPLLDKTGKETIENWIASAGTLLQDDNQEILWIVEEEAQAYLEGKVDVKTAASYMQNRVHTYVNEKR